MPISGIFFVPLHSQSDRKTMFKMTDPNPQLDMFTAPVMQLGQSCFQEVFRSPGMAQPVLQPRNDIDRRGDFQASVPGRQEERPSQCLHPCARGHVDTEGGLWL